MMSRHIKRPGGHRFSCTQGNHSSRYIVGFGKIILAFGVWYTSIYNKDISLLGSSAPRRGVPCVDQGDENPKCPSAQLFGLSYPKTTN